MSYFKGIFELECDLDVEEDKIKSFFIGKLIEIISIKLIEKNTSEKNKIIYQIEFKRTQESLSGLEIMRSQGLYDYNKFKIIKIEATNSFLEIASKLIAEEASRKNIFYPIKYEDIIRTSFMKGYVKEGIEFINQEIIKKQRGVLTYMIKKIGANILNGKSIMNVSLPINIFDCRSMLDNFAYGYKFCPYFLDRGEINGNLDRLKSSFSFLVSTLHLGLGTGKPFNPIIGETFQAKIGKTEIYMEQTSHHPPIFNYYIKHPDFIGFGYSQMEAIGGANSMSATNNGKFYMKYNDGTLHRFYVPKFNLIGVILGKRYMNFEGSIKVEDLTNNLIAVAKLNEDDRGVFGKLFSSKKNFPDHFTGFIANSNDVIFDSDKNLHRVKSDDFVLAKIEGEWSRYLKIDGKDYWRQGETPLAEMEKMDFTLPSDCLLREDIVLFKNNYEDFAQEAKTYLEETQRNDRQLREKYAIK